MAAQASRGGQSKLDKALDAATQFQNPAIEEDPRPVRRVQIVATILYGLGLIALIGYFMINAVTTKSFEQAYAEYPTPSKIQDLQARAERGEIVSLSCPCTATDVPRKAYATTTLVEDSYCRAVTLWMTYMLVSLEDEGGVGRGHTSR